MAPLDALAKARDQSDREHSDLMAVVHAAGLTAEQQELIGRCFHSLQELRLAYERCPGLQQRQLLLAPLLQLLNDDSQDPSATAAEASCQLFAACGNANVQSPVSVSVPQTKLSLAATTGIGKDACLVTIWAVPYAAVQAAKCP